MSAEQVSSDHAVVIPLPNVLTTPHASVTRWPKRAFDFVSAAILLALLAVPMALIALAVRLSGHGPVFFRQARVGLHGRDFMMIKFRSMVCTAEEILPQLTSESNNVIMFKMKADPRVTRVGRFLRRYSLDELPQLFNVLTGDMSLVGPRPPLAHEVRQYSPAARRRLLVKPGMTGLWQISGRADLTWDESIALDLRYVDTWSFGLDLRILRKTASVVVGARGAY